MYSSVMTTPSASSAIHAVVTGHSRGLGEAIANQLLGRGVRVLGVSRHGNKELATNHEGLEEAKLDLADSPDLLRWLGSGSLERFVADAHTAVLVNNAGLLKPIGPPESQEIEDVGRAVAVNVGAVLMLTAAFARATADIADRRVLHISSGAGRKPYAGWSIYCATKAALDQHARCVALDNSPRLLVSSIAPGVIDTEMQAEIRNSRDDLFPERPRFVAMHNDKSLPSAAERAEGIVDYLLSNVFGRESVSDLRELQQQATSPLIGG
jgi:benzil reductase ((S)-benzoin forming)